MTLKSLGWIGAYDSDQQENIARITAVHRSHLCALTSSKEVNLYMTGSLDSPPVIGDFVEISPEFIDEQNKPAAVITNVLERKSTFARPGNYGTELLASNIDTVFILTSANMDFNLNRVRRFMLLVKEGGANPVVILSKTDLVQDANELLAKIGSKLQEQVIAISSLQGSGIDEIKSVMPKGSTSIFVGSSGVGKSTLVNTLLGVNAQETGEIREDDSKGRHVTSSSKLYFLDNGAMVIDSPGVRSVSVFGAEENLLEAFPRVEELMTHCKFSDCSHTKEPGCAVQSALEDGSLSESEWDEFRKLQKEMAHANRKASKEEASNSKRRWKKIHQNAKARLKVEKGR
jgi:ribosome biogenesis GTPase